MKNEENIYTWFDFSVLFWIFGKDNFGRVWRRYSFSRLRQVAGMDYRKFRRDRDFRKAVRYIAEDCQVRDDRITC